MDNTIGTEKGQKQWSSLPDGVQLELTRSVDPVVAAETVTPAGTFALLAATVQQVMQYNAKRRWAVVSNTSASEPVYVCFGNRSQCVVAAGVKLTAGGSCWFGLETDWKYTGDVFVIAAAAATVGTVEA